MLFRQRVSFQGASNVRRHACGEMAAHNVPTNAYHRSPSLRQSSFPAFSSPPSTVDSTHQHTSTALSPPRDFRWKRGRPVTFSSRAFSTQPANSTLQAGHAAIGPKAPLVQEQAQDQEELGIDAVQSRQHLLGYGGTMAAEHQDICVGRFECVMHCDHATANHVDQAVTTSASSEEAYLEDPPNASTVTTHGVPSGGRDSDKHGTGPQAPPTSLGNYTMDDATDSDYLQSSTDESANDLENDATETDKADEEVSETHTPLEFQIPEDVLRAAMTAPENTKASFWSSNLYRGSEGKQILVHYCKTKAVSERVARHFVNEKVVGFDIEWKPWASASSIKKNVSLIQLACENRIALFHIARFTETTAAQLMPPTLKSILESPDVYKVGVAVKGDFTRISKFLEVEPRGVFELSRLHNLVQFFATETKVTNKLVNLAAQVHQHLQLPLYKGGQLIDDPEDLSNVRSSDWSLELNLQQIHYAAADAYAGFRLYDVLEEKRKQLKPTPPRPLVCDYDSKPAPKSSKPGKSRKSTTKADDTAVDVVKEAVAPVEQEQEAVDESLEEPKETQETEGYETAQEELIDSHQLEGEDLESSLESLEGSSESEDNLSIESVPQTKEGRTVAGTGPSQKRVGRINLSQLKGPDPGYPILPSVSGGDEAYTSSDEDLVDLDASVTKTLEDRNVSVEILKEEGESGSDEFEDSELEEALMKLNVDGDGRLQKETSVATTCRWTAISDHTDHFPSPGLGAEEMVEGEVPHAEGLVVNPSPPQPKANEPVPTANNDIADEEEQRLIDLLEDPEIVEYLHSPTQPSTPSLPPPSPTEPSPTEPSPTPSSPPHSPEYNLATSWAQAYLTSTIPSPTSLTPSHIRATIPHLRAYHMWRDQQLSLSEIARHLRDPPLSEATVGSYVLQAIVLQRMEYDVEAVRGVLMGLPEALRRGKWRVLSEKVGAR